MPYHSTPLDLAFHALSDPTRRAVLSRLAEGEVPVSTLAEPFDMALPSFMQHLSVLERSRLVRSTKRGRVRTYSLAPTPLKAAEHWLDRQRALWEGRLDRLDDFLIKLKEQQT
jgi:DNA-binding transcriptional ArsR family regulator